MRWRWRLYLSVIGSIGSSKWSARRPIVNSFPYNSIKQRYLPMCSNILSESNSWKDSLVTTRIRLDISQVFRVRETEGEKKKKKEKLNLSSTLGYFVFFFFVSLSNPKRSIGISRFGCWLSFLNLTFFSFHFSPRIIFSLNSCCVRK